MIVVLLSSLFSSLFNVITDAKLMVLAVTVSQVLALVAMR